VLSSCDLATEAGAICRQHASWLRSASADQMYGLTVRMHQYVQR